MEYRQASPPPLKGKWNKTAQGLAFEESFIQVLQVRE